MDLLKRANREVWQKYDIVSNSSKRLNYHLMPPTGWMNDPNGLIYYQQEYHVFYQHDPFDVKQGKMYWGHLSSANLVDWKHCPVALAPDQPYEDSCFSGCAIVDQGLLKLIYTAHRDDEKPKEIQCIATSSNGAIFEKYHGNPVIGYPPEDASFDFRDPKVWMHQGLWYMVLGSGKEDIGKVLLYRSQNLIDWQYMGVLYESDNPKDNVLECPDLFPLGDAHVLVVSSIHTSKNMLIVGHMDYQTCQFTQIHQQNMDYGEDIYASQSMLAPDGRRMVISWMEKWRDQYITAAEGWVGAMCLPRKWMLQDGHVWIQPIDEIKELRFNQQQYGAIQVSPDKKQYLQDLRGDSLEIELTIKGMDDLCQSAGIFLRMSEDAKEYTKIYFDPHKRLVVMDRSCSGIGSGKITEAPVLLNEEQSVHLHIFVDRSSVEVFINHGYAVITNRIYPNSNSLDYDLFTIGGTAICELSAWQLRSIW